MRKTPPIKIIVHYPQTQQGKQELAQRLADVHADAVVSSWTAPSNKSWTCCKP